MLTGGRFTGHVVRSRRGLSLGVVSVKTSVSVAVTVASVVLLATSAWYSCGQQHRSSCLHADCPFTSQSTIHHKSVLLTRVCCFVEGLFSLF